MKNILATEYAKQITENAEKSFVERCVKLSALCGG